MFPIESARSRKVYGEFYGDRGALGSDVRAGDEALAQPVLPAQKAGAAGLALDIQSGGRQP